MQLKRTILIAATLSVQVGLVFGQNNCVDGFAGSYPCDGINLQAFVAKGELGGGNMNDVWGWTDPISGIEYVLAGRSSGVAFVDISRPIAPLYIGNLPTETNSSTWRDIKVYKNYAFVVADNVSNHGMQVFDLTRLRNVVTTPVQFSPDAVYRRVASAHNIAINEQSGFAYIVGSGECGGGLHMVDISTPLEPVFAGCFSDDGYTHDVQCVNYSGPDVDYAGREICFASNTDTVTIVDVTDKESPVLIFRIGYPNSGYVHQGWLTADQSHFIQNDELDEIHSQSNTTTYFWDVTDLDSPELVQTYVGTSTSIDHNLYNRGNYTFQSNYTSGLRILDTSNIGDVKEVAFFDTYPANDGRTFSGSWSNYPYFNSGNIPVTSIGEGLFILRPSVGLLPVQLLSFSAAVQAAAQVQLLWQTGDEAAIAEYYIQKRTDGGSFVNLNANESAGIVAGAGNYSVEVNNLPPGPQVFRLLIRTTQGEEFFSDPISVFVPLAGTHELFAAYPNPFSSSTTLGLVVKEEQNVTIIVYDSAGRERATIHDGTVSPDARHTFRFDGSDMSAGVYFVRVNGDYFSESRSITIIK